MKAGAVAPPLPTPMIESVSMGTEHEQNHSSYAVFKNPPLQQIYVPQVHKNGKPKSLIQLFPYLVLISGCHFVPGLRVVLAIPSEKHHNQITTIASSPWAFR